MGRKRTNPSCPVCGKRMRLAQRSIYRQGWNRDESFYFRCIDGACPSRVY